MDPGSDSFQDVKGDAVNLLHIASDQEQNGNCPNQDSNQNEQNMTDQKNDDVGGAEGLSGDEKVSETVNVQRLVVGTEGQCHHLCQQPEPSTCITLTSIGGSISPNMFQLVEAIVRSEEHASYDSAVEIRRDSDRTRNEVHFHLTQTNINNPTVISLGGQVVVQPPKKDETPETPQVPTEMQKLRSETERNFEKWTEDMVKTRATQVVLDKISQGRTWITVTGSPGEGKTTAGYLVLKHLHSMGRQVYDIKTREDYFKVKQARQPVIMLNDIFGSLHFDLNDVKKWEKVIRDVLGMKEHKMDVDMDFRDKKKPQVTIILISRSSVLKEASHHLVRFRDLVLKEDCVVDFTHDLDTEPNESMKIWKSNSKGYNIDVSEKTIKEVCKMPTPHGFPHCCRLFAGLYSKNKHLNMKSFFSKPLEFLNQTMESLMMDDITGPLLREMLRHDGSLDLDSIEDDGKRLQYKTVANTLTGTYLSHDRGIVTFHHPSVYDSAALVACKNDPLFVVKYCRLSFLNERVIFSELESGSEKVRTCKVEISNKYIQNMLDRLKLEYEKRNISLVLSHQSFYDASFTEKFMGRILPFTDDNHFSDGVKEMIHKKDTLSKESFLYLMTKSRSDKILKYVCKVIELSQDDLAETLFGICEHSSVPALNYFLRNNNDFNLNLTNSKYQTPLMVASKKSSGCILKLLLEKGVDVNIRAEGSDSVLHYICSHGVEEDDDAADIVKMLVDKAVFRVEDFLQFPPLHIACSEGHKNLVIALIQCGNDVNEISILHTTPLTTACAMSHLDVVNVLLDRGADINKSVIDGVTSLHKACYGGHVDVVTVLLDGKADINKTNSDGDTPLHIASYEGHLDVVTVLLDRGADANMINNEGNTDVDEEPYCKEIYIPHGTSLTLASEMNHLDVVKVLLEKGADINGSISDGVTSLHKACDRGHVDVVTVLLDRGADANVTNNKGKTIVDPIYGNPYGMIPHGTPLTIACEMNRLDVVKVLLDRGADINKTNGDGDTSLHRACYWGHADVVKVLLDKGADANMVNNEGKTPLSVVDPIYKPDID